MRSLRTQEKAVSSWLEISTIDHSETEEPSLQVQYDDNYYSQMGAYVNNV